MNEFESKCAMFLTALADVYRSEDDRELGAFSKLEDSDDYTEDMTAILLAMHVFCEHVSSFEGDLIDFTHVLNKLAIQHVMEAQKEDGK